ncbi:MAG: vWA domain-containing protein [Myxococcota bacterium]
MNLTSQLFVACLAALALTLAGGCGDDAPETPAGFGGNGDAESTVSGDGQRGDGERIIFGDGDALAPVTPEDTTEEGVSCEPGEPVCLSDEAWAVCHPNGRALLAPHGCASTARCNPALGHCAMIVCDAEVPSCADWQTPQRCNSTGTGYEVSEACQGWGTCVDGACQTCRPGEGACVSLKVAGTCDAEGTSILEGSEVNCAEGEVCLGEKGACGVPLCQPDAWRCLNPFVYQVCDDTGSSWLSSEPCPDEFVCHAEVCEYAPCVPTVLFVVDRSGSMDPHWEAVSAEVRALVEGNPDALFGLKAFPSGTGGNGCGVSNSLQIGFDFADVETFDDYFNASPPSGMTPLAETMEYLALSASTVFGVYRANIVVLSDGSETCTSEDPTSRLADAVNQLHLVHGVRTYVIGYNYEGDPGQLDAMASAGGTTYSTHIQAGDAGTLSEAFEDVVDDIKLCSH